LVISEEPTLGYVVFVCEIKSPVPPGWSKDYLRALNKDSVSKAFHQVKAISDFLGTEPGVMFLRQQLPAENPKHFDGFVVAVFTLIVTSSNAGMFFSGSDQAISFHQNQWRGMLPRLVNLATDARLLVLRRWVFGFKLVSVRIKNEGGIVVCSVMQPEAGSTLVNAAEF
jgi:hypothetical protein